MATTVTHYTTTDLARMPGDEPWELWEGELRKVPSAGGEASVIAHWIGVLISLFVMPRQLGVVSGADGSYILARDPDTVVVPDIAFVRWDRLPGGQVPRGFIPVPPDLAVEVIGWTPWPRPPFEAKMALYHRARVPLVWKVESEAQTVTVFRGGRLEAELIEDDELDGEEVLPGFRLPVAEIFAEA